MKAIVHVDKNWGIGRGNSLMFRLPADMKFFRQTTTGNTVVIGGNTLRSFPGGLPLKDRLNIVLSKNIEDRQDCIVVRSESQLFDAIKRRAVGEVYVAGGASIYKLLLPYCESVLVTKVDADGGRFSPIWMLTTALHLKVAATILLQTVSQSECVYTEIFFPRKYNF